MLPLAPSRAKYVFRISPTRNSHYLLSNSDLKRCPPTHAVLAFLRKLCIHLQISPHEITHSPWLYPAPSISFHLLLMSKSNSHAPGLQVSFLSHIIPIYMDGSKLVIIVATSAIFPDRNLIYSDIHSRVSYQNNGTRYVIC